MSYFINNACAEIINPVAFVTGFFLTNCGAAMILLLCHSLHPTELWGAMISFTKREEAYQKVKTEKHFII
jgi:hypothetical protein